MSHPPNVSTQNVTAAPGGSATFREPSVPDIPVPTPDPSRAITPDATGFYEADPLAPMWNSNRLLQVNQAGHALVAWFVLPPVEFVQSLQEYPVGTAVLVADLRATVNNGVQFYYREVDSIDGIDPDCVLSPLEPFDPGTHPDGLYPGTIQIQTASDLTGWNASTPRVSVTLTFMRADGTETPPLTFIHMQPCARASERIINAQSHNLKQVLVARHRRPIPSSFFDTSKACGRVWRDAVALFDPDPGGKLATAIRMYQADADTSGPGGSACRSQALKQIGDALSFFWDSTPHENMLNLRLEVYALQKLTIGSETKSYRDWLSGIAVNEVEKCETSGDPDLAHSNPTVYPQEIGKVIAGADIYRYTLTFSTDARKATRLAPFVHGAAAAFQVTVTPAYAKLRKDGRLPPDDSFKKLKNERSEPFHGAFLEIGGGSGNLPTLPESVDVYSADRLSAADFRGAVFEVYSLSAKTSNSKSINDMFLSIKEDFRVGEETAFIAIHLKHHVLRGVYAKGSFVPTLVTSGNLKEPPDWSELRKTFSKRGIAEIKDFLDPRKGWSVALGACAGLGLIEVPQGFPEWMHPASSDVHSGSLAGAAGRQVAAYFDRGSADFTKKRVNGWEVRYLLETVLATDKILFNGAPSVDVVGHASPEATPRYNLILSQRRAAAVIQAILDAVGSLQPELTTATWRGDTDAISSGLDDPDPTGSPGELAEFEKTHHKQVAEWPQWRKVTIEVRGRFSVDVIAVDQDAG